MNEKISTLAKQANEMARALEPDLREVVRYNHIRDQKFAELIVKECMSNLYLHGYDDARTQIKQHFGVEE